MNSSTYSSPITSSLGGSSSYADSFSSSNTLLSPITSSLSSNNNSALPMMTPPNMDFLLSPADPHAGLKANIDYLTKSSQADHNRLDKEIKTNWYNDPLHKHSGHTPPPSPPPALTDKRYYTSLSDMPDTCTVSAVVSGCTDAVTSNTGLTAIAIGAFTGLRNTAPVALENPTAPLIGGC